MQELDARGLLCPLPVLKARKRLLGMQTGEALVVLADDPMAAIDMPHFCAEAGHDLLEQQPRDGALRFVIRRG
ncbi:sulfurtransferase TusA family protein [Pseudooceanicola sp. CBS1P-1]|uniref:UPF0033 domain-containing protein n=1 Tax=Pseudooceanicola albus TaxID=2692189 RepID=A0A6L7G235_9RHOB|nr:MULTISPECIES: sulfurtransferase TusA family protein [Pseudooceanicola]MBT9383645.1 sulfurtransferase TusA family protein [Pseudooceanicola endophyticus]MXN17500.1 hypothetical protein [Pseudooceanicola albus]